MNKPISLVVLVAGVALILYGIYTSSSFSSDFSRIFTGSPAEKAIALLCGGAVFAVLGGYGISRRSRSY